MAKQQLPKTLAEADKKTLQNLIVATEQRFAGDLFGEVNSPLNEAYTTPDGSIHFSTTKDLLVYITDLTDTNDVRSANRVLYQTLSKSPEYEKPTMTSAPEYAVSSNIPQEGLRAQQEAERVRIKEIKRESYEKTKAQTEAEITKRQEYVKQRQTIQDQLTKSRAAQEALQGKKISVKVEIPKAPVLSEDEQTAYTKLKDLSQKNPRQITEELSSVIQAKIPESIKQKSSPEEIKLYADSTAIKAVENLRKASPPAPDIETAILVAAATDENLLQKYINQPQVQIVLDQGLGDIARLKLTAYQAPASALDMIVGPNIRKLILGPNPAEIRASFQSQGATHELDFGKLNSNYQDVLQNPIFSFAQDEIKGKLLSFGKEQLLSKLGSFPPDSALGKLTMSNEFQSALTMLRPYTSFEFVGAEGLPGMFGKFVMQFSPESAPLLSGFGNMIGVDFGIAPISSAVIPVATDVLTAGIGGEVAATGGGVIAGEIAGTTAGVAAGEAVGVAAGTAAGTATGTAAGAAAGSVVPGPGTIIGAVIGFFVALAPKITNWLKDKTRDLGKYLIAGLGIGIGAVIGAATGIGAVTGGIVGGLGGFGLATGLSGGLPAIGASISAGATTAFTALGTVMGTFLAGIAAPIIAFLVGFPLLIVFILIIINSGAYVVPPAPPDSGFIGSGIKIECSDEKGPVGVDGPSSTSPIANRAWEITYDLYQGFWCYWNRSPIAPPQYFPNDTLKYPPGYPNKFGYEQFIKDPNPVSGVGLSMYWCTYLVIDAYHEKGNNIPANEAATNMFNDFNNRNKVISNDHLNYPSKSPVYVNTYPNAGNIVPGSVVFFHVSTGHSNVNHVGIVYSVDPGGIIFVQSNSSLKSQSLNFTANGVGNITDGNVTIYVVGFGLP